MDTRTQRQQADLVTTRSTNLFWALDRTSSTREVLARAEELLAGGSSSDEVEALRAKVSLISGRTLEALDWARTRLNHLGIDERTMLSALLVAADAWAIHGRTKKALEAAHSGIDLATRYTAELPNARRSLVAATARAQRLAGELITAETLTDRAYRESVEQHDSESHAVWVVLLGQAALARGKVRSAAGWFQEGAVLSRDLGSLGQLPWCLANLAQALALAGDPAGARAALAEFDSLPDGLPPLFELDVALARAWTAAAQGEVSEAAALALKAAQTAHASRQFALSAVAFHEVVRFGVARPVRARLESLVSVVDGPLLKTFAAHAAALTAADASALEEVARSFEAMGACLLAAEALSEAAAAHRRTGRTTRVVASSTRARALADLCEGARTPALAGPEPDPLTRRERQVAILAGQGFSNSAIATRLFVSVRTVENHLHRVYAKLGVTCRKHLPEAVGIPTVPCASDATEHQTE
jgi:ATP/maltotriose-dependent transcriptional regulator MalT